MREIEQFEKLLADLETSVNHLHIGDVKMDGSIFAEALTQVNERKRQKAVDKAANLICELDDNKVQGLAKIAELRKVNKELEKRRKSIERIMSGKPPEIADEKESTDS